MAFFSAFTTMKFLDWCESVAHLVIPLAVDISLALCGAGLLTALLRFVLELAA